MSSPFAIRGVIEGFYGTPWTHEQRLDMIEFIARHGMNTFAYAPKDDPYLRRRWREPYDGPDLDRLAELVAAAADAELTFLYGLSPGLSMRYSDGSETDRVLAKYDQVRALGVETFGLLLDDIPAELQHPADREAYPDLVSAHVDVVNGVYAGLVEQSPQAAMVVCPTQYWGRGDEDYISRLGQGIDARIDLFWTGRAICSPSLDLADAAAFLRSTNRPPLYWDNYPVNDVAMTHELHIGPYRERDRHLHRFSRGVIANAMEHPEASKIAIATIADYLHDPESYEPESSWDEAIGEVVGDADAGLFRCFADNVRTSCLSPDDAPLLADALTRFAFEYDHGDRDRGCAALAAVADKLTAAARGLRGGADGQPGATGRGRALDHQVRRRRRGADRGHGPGAGRTTRVGRGRGNPRRPPEPAQRRPVPRVRRRVGDVSGRPRRASRRQQTRRGGRMTLRHDPSAHFPRNHAARALAATFGAVAMIALTACGSGDDEGGGTADRPLRIAMGSPGEAQVAVWEEAADLYEERTGVEVELNIQDDDLYQTIGLTNLLTSGEPPDIYFEWTGARLESRYAEGYAADLSDAVSDGPLAGLFSDGDFKGMEVDGKTVMVPGAADVTNVLWYNTEIFADLDLTPPESWDDLLATCQALNDAGITPIASGNADLWAAGNWLAHQSSRVVGEDVYVDALSRESTFDTAEWEDALGYVAELRDSGCVNESVNAINDNEGAQLFFQGTAAMHPIGSWLVSWAIEEAPDLSFDYVNLPAMPGGAGSQDSVIGVATGYVVNAESDMIDEAVDFLALFNSEEIVDKLVEAGLVPMAEAAAEAEGVDDRLLRLGTLLEEAETLVAPPDTGYDLQVADALYAALADVLGGQKTPEEALADAEAKLE